MSSTHTQAFDKEFLATIKNLLEENKILIQNELGNITSKDMGSKTDVDKAFPKYGDEEDDNAREVADYTTNKPLEITFDKTLVDINKALERLSKGTYGICKYCDQPIAEKRLLARPTSSACVSCKKTLTDEVQVEFSMTKRIHSSLFFLSGFFLLSDQLVKNYFINHQDFTAYFIEPWLGLEYFQNPGVAFGIPIPNGVTLFYTPLVLLVLLLFLFKKNSSLKKVLGLSLITCGALSNFIDRISVGFTIDYIRVVTSILNIADIMIVTGALLVLLEEIQKKK